MKEKLANGVGSQPNADYVHLVVSIEVAVEVCCCYVTCHSIQLLNSG